MAAILVSAFAHLHVTGVDTALFASKGFPLLIYFNEPPCWFVCVWTPSSCGTGSAVDKALRSVKLCGQLPCS